MYKDTHKIINKYIKSTRKELTKNRSTKKSQEYRDSLLIMKSVLTLSADWINSIAVYVSAHMTNYKPSTKLRSQEIPWLYFTLTNQIIIKSEINLCHNTIPIKSL